MINFIIILIFVLTIAITSASTLVTSHLRVSYKTGFFSSLLFFQVFYFTFGYYAIWGQVILIHILTPHISAENLTKITDITILLGTPFLVFASMMFLRFAREISGRKLNNTFILWYLLLNAILIMGIGYIIVYKTPSNSFTVLKYYFLLFNMLFVLAGVYCLITPGRKKTGLDPLDLKNISIALVLLVIIQNSFLFFYRDTIYIALTFIFVYFILGAFIPVYIKYAANLSVLLPQNESSRSLEQFCQRFGISPRETEIINEICNGLSNQQIADKLFISLQTVKDHTHRIYSKTECAGRSQLIHMVNDSTSEK